MTPDVARAILAMDFPKEVHARHETLSAKAQEGTLTSEEVEEMEQYIRLDALLAILRIKAKGFLRDSE